MRTVVLIPLMRLLNKFQSKFQISYADILAESNCRDIQSRNTPFLTDTVGRIAF